MCPRCIVGSFQSTENQIIIETPNSVESRDHEEWEPDWIEDDFSSILKCSNDKCKETTVVSGYTRRDFHQVDWDKYESNMYFYPKCFTTAPLIFRPPPDTPDAVRAELIDAFSLFWLDSKASANKIRNVVESILTDKNVKRFYVKNKKRKRLDTHARILEYENSDPENAKLLMGLKWVGNANSHVTTEEVSKDELLDVFELCEHVVMSIYTKKSKDMAKRAEIYTSRKGKPIPTRKKKR